MIDSIKNKDLAQAETLLKNGENVNAANEQGKGNNAPKAVNAKDYEILQKHLSTAFGVPVKFTCDQSGKGKITFPFTTDEQLVKIISIFDQLKDA